VLTDLFGSCRRQDVLGVDATAPEYQLPAELLLQGGRIHVGRTDLHGIQNVNAVFDQIGQVLQARAAGVVQILAGVRERMYCTKVFCRGLTMRR